MELLHSLIERRRDPAVHIRILQLDQSLPDDSAVMDDKHLGSSNGLDEYGVSGEPVPDNNSGNHNDEEGARRPKLNKEIQGKAIRSMCETWSTEFEINSSQVDLMSCSYQ